MHTGRLIRMSLVTVSVALVAIIYGCSNTTVVGADRTLEIALTEYRLNPQSVRVRAGQLTIVVHNYGRVAHNLAVSRGGQTTGETAPILPGASAELSLDLAPGQYLMTSTLFSDQILGQYGSLTVTS